MFCVAPPAEALIRPAVAGEAARLSALALRSKAHWGYDAKFIAACRAELTFDSNYLCSNSVFVAEVGGKSVGFYALERLSDTEAELGALFVEPENIGFGFGRALMSHAKKTAVELGFASIVIQGDPNASDFYRADGGVQFGRRPSRSIPNRLLPLFRIKLDTSGGR